MRGVSRFKQIVEAHGGKCPGAEGISHQQKEQPCKVKECPGNVICIAFAE